MIGLMYSFYYPPNLAYAFPYQRDRLIERQIDRQIHRWMDGWIGRWIDRWMDGQVDVWIDRWMYRLDVQSLLFPNLGYALTY